MYGSTGQSSYANTHRNTNDSTIKGILDEWYEENLLDNHADKLSTEAGFCNDRQTQTVVSGSATYGTTGYGTNITGYAPWGRLYENSAWKTSQTPSLRCSQASSDLFTVSGSSKGNHALTYPIGLITSDEVVLAGGFGNATNNSYYLYTNQYYWTMSPRNFDGAHAGVFPVYSAGQLYINDVLGTYGVRPVINLSPDVTISGSGTASDPYTVVEA